MFFIPYVLVFGICILVMIMGTTCFWRAIVEAAQLEYYMSDNNHSKLYVRIGYAYMQYNDVDVIIKTKKS